MKDGLTEKQKRFCDEYLIDLNATQAAIRAGYSTKTAAVVGHENLIKPYIAKYISERQKDLQKRTEITQERVLQEYARIAFFDPRKLFDSNGRPKDITELDDDTAAVIAGMDVQEIADLASVKKIKLADKKGALDSVARTLGMFNDKIEVTGPSITFIDNVKPVAPDEEEIKTFGGE